MNILENAEKYAEGKANQAITKAIADAYVEGYKAGYKDREEEIPMDLRDNKTEYVDLGLPSGTLWASDYEKLGGKYIYLPYEKAKYMKLPTKAQRKELIDKCEKKYDWINEPKANYFKVTFIAANGNSIAFLGKGYYITNKEDINDVLFWLQNEGNDSVKDAVSMNSTTKDKKLEPQKYFAGFKLPIRLVR